MAHCIVLAGIRAVLRNLSHCLGYGNAEITCPAGHIQHLNAPEPPFLINLPSGSAFLPGGLQNPLERPLPPAFVNVEGHYVVQLVVVCGNAVEHIVNLLLAGHKFIF